MSAVAKPGVTTSQCLSLKEANSFGWGECLERDGALSWRCATKVRMTVELSNVC